MEDSEYIHWEDFYPHARKIVDFCTLLYPHIWTMLRERGPDEAVDVIRRTLPTCELDEEDTEKCLEQLQTQDFLTYFRAKMGLL